MAEESFMLVSLKESKAKKLAQVISNETCRKILDYLSKHEATETEMSKALGMPLSTVHYNLQHLVENKLVIAEEFHYSQKGKEVLHYKLANKLIIIAPEETDKGLMEKLKALLPVGAITIAAAFVLGFVSRLYQGGAFFGTFAQKATQAAYSRAATSEALTASQAADQTLAVATTTSTAAPTAIGFNSIAIWFFIGAVFSLTVYFIVEKIRKSR